MIAVEALLAKLFASPKPSGNGKSLPWHYRFNDFVASTISGSFQQTLGLFLELCGLALDMGLYIYVYNHWRFTTVDPTQMPYTTF